jgi:hypothetical protein
MICSDAGYFCGLLDMQNRLRRFCCVWRQPNPDHICPSVDLDRIKSPGIERQPKAVRRIGIEGDGMVMSVDVLSWCRCIDS